MILTHTSAQISGGRRAVRMHSKYLVRDSRGDEWTVRVSGPISAQLTPDEIRYFWLARFELRSDTLVSITADYEGWDTPDMRLLLEKCGEWRAQEWTKTRTSPPDEFSAAHTESTP